MEQVNRKIDFKKHVEDYRNRLVQLFNSMDLDLLEDIIDVLIKCFKEGKTLYIAGNGGSAATSSHMQCDFSFFVRHYTRFRPKVVALTDCTPLLTAIGNDNSYDDIFVEQLKGSFEEGDVLLTISASGNSKNVIKAAEYANEMRGTTICFVGFEGGILKDISRLSLHTPNEKGDYGPIEDLHMILDHLLVTFMVKDAEFLSIQ